MYELIGVDVLRLDDVPVRASADHLDGLVLLPDFLGWEVDFLQGQDLGLHHNIIWRDRNV